MKNISLLQIIILLFLSLLIFNDLPMLKKKLKKILKNFSDLVNKKFK